MSELEVSPPRNWAQPSDELSGPYGPFLNSEVNPVAFPNYEFDLQPHRLFSEGVIEVTPEARLRYCLRNINEQCGQDTPDLISLTDPQAAMWQQHAEKKYLDARIKVGQGVIPRRQLIDRRHAIDQIMVGLQYLNHPAAQLFEQVIKQANGRLIRSDAERLEADLVTVVAWPDLKKFYQEQIEVARGRYIVASPLNNS